MKLTTYIKSKIGYLITQAIIIIYILLFLLICELNLSAIFLIISFCLIISIAYLFFDYFTKRSFYKNINKFVNNKDYYKYSDGFIDKPSFADGLIIYNYINGVSNYLNEQISQYKIYEKEYQEYLEKWLHEIKIPISCLDLICENNKTDLTKTIKFENKKIYDLVIQALYYSKSNYLETDIKIKGFNIDELINECLRNNSIELIEAKTEVNKINTNCIIYSDYKWIYFIINQILSNCIKYKKNNLKLKFEGIKEDYHFSLSITDNGIGISQSDISRVFEKGFTGSNTNLEYKSTGIGLYLIKKMANKLNINIEISSKINEFTTVTINFPIDDNYNKMTKM